jgi:hypothetical protein
MSTIALSGGPLESADAEGWAAGEVKVFADPANGKLEVGYRRLPPDELTDEDPMQAVYIGRRRVGTIDWK